MHGNTKIKCFNTSTPGVFREIVFIYFCNSLSLSLFFFFFLTARKYFQCVSHNVSLFLTLPTLRSIETELANFVVLSVNSGGMMCAQQICRLVEPRKLNDPHCSTYASSSITIFVTYTQTAPRQGTLYTA